MSELLLPALQRQALLLSLGVLLLLGLRPLLLKRLGARATYAAWLLLPALLVTPLLPSAGARPLPVFATVADLTRTATAPLLTAPKPEATWPRLLLAAWLAGAALVLALQAARQWRLARHGTQLPAGSSPALVGLWKPRVALPADFEARFTPDERQLILAHEDVHRARHDNAWNLLACTLTALHWWNPLAWAAACRMQADQELACDAVVLGQRPGALATYTRALLAAHDLTPHGAPLASRWGSAHPLVERIAMLNAAPRCTRRHTLLALTTLMAAAGMAYAAQGTVPTPDATQVELKLDIRHITGTDKARNNMTSQPTVRIALGERSLVIFNGTPDHPTPETLSIAIEARDLGDDKIELQAEISRGAPLNVVARPKLITGNGVKATIELGDNNSAAMDLLTLVVTPTLLGPHKP